MKITSFTRMAVHGRCPRRFYYRYQAAKDQPELQETIQGLNRLHGVRELTGHIAHRSLAEAIRLTMTEGLSRREEEAIFARMDAAFREIVDRSLRAGPGRLLPEGLQVAEIFNGRNAAEACAEARELLPVFLRNGLDYVGALRLERGQWFLVEAEDRMPTARGAFQVRVDLAFAKGDTVVVVDWKTKRWPTEDDRLQMHGYLEWARRVRKAPPARLFGMIVSLWNGQAERVRFDPLHPLSHSDRSGGAPRGGPGKPIPSAPPCPPLERYPASPSEACLACSYATLCPDAKGGAK